MAEIVIGDTGHGLTAETRERLFLPYFSTKQRGTGLGLSIAAKIIQEHQGAIRAEQNVPQGARFVLELPLVESPALATSAGGAAASSRSRNGAPNGNAGNGQSAVNGNGAHGAVDTHRNEADRNGTDRNGAYENAIRVEMELTELSSAPLILTTRDDPSA